VGVEPWAKTACVQPSVAKQSRWWYWHTHTTHTN